MSKFYNPTTGQLLTPGTAKNILGGSGIVSKETLVELGYLPYVDPLEGLTNEVVNDLFIPELIIEYKGKAIQTYRLNPDFMATGKYIRKELSKMPQAADDAAAAAAGVEIGELYNNNGDVKIRMT